ncbi:MAG: hypothetical protein U0T02_01840 [Solirubrobacteraceae bacterium]
MLEKTTIRFSRRAMVLIREAAEREGVSAAEFIREASLARVYFVMEGEERREIETVMEWVKTAMRDD